MWGSSALSRCFLPKGEASTFRPPLLTAACSGKLEQHTERRGVIYSPAWPLNYPPGTNCSWYIQGDRGDMITIRYVGSGGCQRNPCGSACAECVCVSAHVCWCMYTSACVSRCASMYIWEHMCGHVWRAHA